jgi:hypothetical protein
MTKSNIAGQQYLEFIPYGVGVTTLRIGKSNPVSLWMLHAAKTANYTLTDTDTVVTFNGTGIAATLPSAVTVGAGKTFHVKNLNAEALEVGRTSSQTIDGTAADDSLAQFESVTYTSDGANWIVTGNYTP